MTENDIKEHVLRRPHIVIFGAGATMAAIPNGDKFGKRCSVMEGFIDNLGLRPLLNKVGIIPESNNLEEIFSELKSKPEYDKILAELEFFSQSKKRIMEMMPILRMYGRTFLISCPPSQGNERARIIVRKLYQPLFAITKNMLIGGICLYNYSNISKNGCAIFALPLILYCEIIKKGTNTPPIRNIYETTTNYNSGILYGYLRCHRLQCDGRGD